MKLLVVSHSCATALNQQIYARMAALTGWEVVVAIPAAWRDEFGNVLDATPWQGLENRILKVPVFRNGSIIFHTYRKRWTSFLRREQFDAVYVNHEPYAVATAQLALASKRANGIPFAFYSCQNIVKRYPPPFRWMERMVYRQSRAAFPITEAVAEVLRTKGFEGDISVCALPFDPMLYRPYLPSEYPEQLRRGDEVLLGFAGRVVESKGLRTLAQALCRLRDLRWKFALIGSGAFEEEFCAILGAANLRDRIIRTGYIVHDKAPKFLAALDVLVLPSETQPNWKEQFGRVIPEALACGAAVVGSDSGEIPNLVRRSGGGLVFPERNVDALAEVLGRIITDADARHEFARVGREWALSEVALDSVAEKMITTLRTLALRA